MKSQFYLAVSFLTVFILMISTACLFAQPGNIIKGKVFDELQKPVAGARISVKGTDIQRLTDASGAFSVEVPNGESILVVV